MIKKDVGALIERRRGGGISLFFFEKNEVQEFEGMTHEC